MNAKRCFVNSVAQVSCQSPLSDEWMTNPCVINGNYAVTQEPNVGQFISGVAARRMNKMLKRAICVSLSALSQAGINNPDAIITGTGMGCLENSEKFLDDLSADGESCLKPTLFMNSTHNTISSQIAIQLKCHGYNNTYSQKGQSFESALFDAWIQLRNSMINSALVGSHDELTDKFKEVLRLTHQEYGFLSETSVSAVLTNDDSADNLCEISGVELFHRPQIKTLIECLHENPNSVYILGLNGNYINDEPYLNLLQRANIQNTVLKFKNLFGDNYSSSACGFYVGVSLFKRQFIPKELYYSGYQGCANQIESVLIVNHSEMTDWSFVRLTRI